MPTSYAHYRFGQKVVDRLPEQYQYFAYEYPEYFYPALHGPDILFYLMVDARVPNLGNDMHKWSGKQYFEKVGKELLAEMAGDKPSKTTANTPSDVLWDVVCPKTFTFLRKPLRSGMAPQSVLLGEDRDESHGKWTDRTSEKKLAFLYGFLCHYALDRTGHKYINEMVNAGVAGHFELEAEFDRMLMSMDGYDPLHHHVTDHIHPSMKMAETIKQFFPGLNTTEVYATLRAQKELLKSFNLPTNLPRKLLKTVTKAAGIPHYGELIMPEHPLPNCYETNKELLTIFEDTVPECVEFITSLLDMVSGKTPWDERFLWNFDGVYVGE